MNNRITNILDLLQREAILLRHLNETMEEISAACATIAIQTPGIHTAPDIVITESMLGAPDAMPSKLFFITTECLELGTDGIYYDADCEPVEVSFDD